MPGAFLAVLQLFFALTWVVYVIYLPALAQQAGLDRRFVPMILLMDQVIFLVCDWMAGVYADRVARKFARIGGWMATVTLVSCAAFIAMPFAASFAATPFLILTIVWSATSSALRAPPFAIVSRHAPVANQPWVASSYLFGLGLASAIAPYIAIDLRQMDPRIPFALSSVGLALFTYALARAERNAPPSTSPATTTEGAGAPQPSIALLAFVILLFAFGYQVHFAVNSAPAYARLAEESDLPRLMPIFWIGFNIGLVPAALLVKRFGGGAMMAAGGLLGVAALAGCSRAPSIGLLIAAQSIAGAAWSFALTAAFSAALAAGRGGREGLLTGILFSTLAAAAILRIAILLSGKQGSFYLESLPFIVWALAAFLIAMAAFPEKAKPPAPVR
jgi:hypothetical protein